MSGAWRESGVGARAPPVCLAEQDLNRSQADRQRRGGLEGGPGGTGSHTPGSSQTLVREGARLILTQLKMEIHLIYYTNNR